MKILEAKKVSVQFTVFDIARWLTQDKIIPVGTAGDELELDFSTDADGKVTYFVASWQGNPKEREVR